MPSLFRMTGALATTLLLIAKSRADFSIYEVFPPGEGSAGLSAGPTTLSAGPCPSTYYADSGNGQPNADFGWSTGFCGTNDALECDYYPASDGEAASLVCSNLAPAPDGQDSFQCTSDSASFDCSADGETDSTTWMGVYNCPTADFNC